MLEEMKMKKQIIIIAVISIFTLSCTGFFDLRDRENIENLGEKGPDGQVISTTHVWFDNSNNVFPVDVFSSFDRTYKVNTAIIQPNQKTSNISWLPTRENEDFIFYLTFYLPIEGLNIPFIPQSWGSTSVNIPFNKTTKIQIYDLINTVSENAILIDDVCIIIENNFASAVQFNRGSIVLYPDNHKGVMTLNPGLKGLYIVPPANITITATYTIMPNPQTMHNLPSPQITSLAAGNVYIITINASGQPVFKESYPLTMSRFK